MEGTEAPTPAAASSAKKITSRIKEHRRVKLSQLDRFRFGNPKKMADSTRSTLRVSLEEYGVVEAIVVRKAAGKRDRWEILDGHHRFDELSAASGLEAEVDILVVDLPDDDKARGLVLALTAVQGQFDAPKLNDFVETWLKESEGHVTRAWISRSTGLTGADVNALAASGSEFLAGLGGASGGEAAAAMAAAAGAAIGGQGGAGPGAPSTGANGGAGGPAIPPQDNGEHVTFTVPLTPAQSAQVNAALKAARGTIGRGATVADGLALLATRFLGDIA